MTTFEVNRLAQDELVYELKWRGFVADGTVDQMRKSLRDILRHEKSGKPLNYPKYEVVVEEELQAIDNKITEIENLIKIFLEQPSLGVSKKIATKLEHVIGRADRLQADGDISKQRSDNILRVLAVEADYLDKCLPLLRKNIESQSELTAFEQQLLEVSGEVTELNLGNRPTQPVSSSPVRPSRENVSFKVIPVAQWNLRFSGEKDRLSVGAFLERVEELCAARHFPKENLLDSAVDLFEGHALIWYRSVKSSVGSWSELARKLREEFQPHDYDFRLWEEIKRRTQGKNEPIGVYVAIMENLFKRLGNPVGESVKLSVLMRNLAPFYSEKLGLLDIMSVEQLLKLGKNLELRKSLVDSYTPPVKRKTDLEPDLAYVETASCSSMGTTTNIKCWHCHKVGHKASECRGTKKIGQLRCFKCNKEGYTVRTCPDCGKSGNE